MNFSELVSPSWYRALLLVERLKSSPRKDSASASSTNSPDAIRRLSKWRSQSPFDDHDLFVKRLAIDSLTELDLLNLLCETDEELKNKHKLPHWLATLFEAYRRQIKNWDTGLPKPKSESPFHSFLPILRPLITYAIDTVREHASVISKQYPAAPFYPIKVVDALYSLLPNRLGSLLGRAAVLELHVARLQGDLQGETPSVRFQNFITRISDPEASIEFLKEYPVLARLLVESTELWVESSVEFLNRLCADWELIKSFFAPGEDLGTLIDITGGIGDRHRGGRTVLIAQFDSGFKLVYKPKSLAIDEHLNNLLEWLNRRGAPELKAAKVINKGQYGWSEFISPQSCTNRGELKRFYQRQGAFLALLYALEATDFHNENLIAAGEHPILVDLESLFKTDFREESTDNSSSIAVSAMGNSVLRVGLLPQPYRGKDDETLDTSGLGGEEGQISPWEIPVWEDDQTDQMRIARRKLTFLEGSNRPKLNGEAVNIFDFVSDIIDGFTSMYRILLSNRNEILSAEGPLADFRDDEVRFIFRHTRLYATLLYESLHPDFLRDALDRERVFDRLWFNLKNGPYLELVALLIPWEKVDLWRGDIPFFYTQVASRDLWTSSGGHLKDFLLRSGMDAVKTRLELLSHIDLNQQVWLIQSSLSTIALETEPRWIKYPTVWTRTRCNRADFVKAACLIGDRLEELAFRGLEDTSWIGLTIFRGRHWTLAPLWKDLYGGLPGVALFLAYLGAISEQEKYTRIAGQAVRSLRRQIQNGNGFKTLGAFEGWGGLIYCWAHIGVLWNRSEFLLEAEEMIQTTASLIDSDEGLDIVSGSAGALAVALGFHHLTGSPSALNAARSMGEHLLTKIVPVQGGIGWTIPMSPQQPLTGFSHGAAGIAWPMLALGKTLADSRFRDVAIEAIRFENSTFSVEAGNWPDLRGQGKNSAKPTPRFMTAWCHGAPGIGLSRLRMLKDLNDSQIQKEMEKDVEIAVQTTMREGFGSNHSLCHGDLGNIELLLEANHVLERPSWKGEVDRLASLIFTSISESGWRCGVPLGVETPGLLAGLAGIGYGLLRLAEPERIPSVLILDFPSSQHSIFANTTFTERPAQAARDS